MIWYSQPCSSHFRDLFPLRKSIKGYRSATIKLIYKRSLLVLSNILQAVDETQNLHRIFYPISSASQTLHAYSATNSAFVYHRPIPKSHPTAYYTNTTTIPQPHSIRT